MKNVLVITALPFKRQGNQSLIRFVGMFLERGVRVTMFTSGQDARGHNEVADERFVLRRVAALRDGLFTALRSVRRRIRRAQPAASPAVAPSVTAGSSSYATIRSEDVIPPYGPHAPKTALIKWSYFGLLAVDNVLLALSLALFHRGAVRAADLVVGYECDYAPAARLVARAFGKPFVNKYQGTVLKATRRDPRAARLYYPNSWYGLNRADLCVMVDDGTDGDWYARVRGNTQVHYEPHGVAARDYPEHVTVPDSLGLRDRVLLFNNASASKWKRVDRVLRALARVPPDVRAKLLFVTTYHAEDAGELRRFAHELKLDDCVRFVDRLDHVQSNAFLRSARALVMTNEMSNLGNPVLEALHYRIPVISLNDGSLDGYVRQGVTGILVDLDPRLDEALAAAIVRVVNDVCLVEGFRRAMGPHPKVQPVRVQQDKEFRAIAAVVSRTGGHGAEDRRKVAPPAG